MQKKKELGFYIATIISCALALCVVTVTIFLIIAKIREDNQHKPAVNETASSESGTVNEDVFTLEEVNELIAEANASTEQITADRVREEILDAIRLSLESGTSTVETLRPLYPNDLVVVSNGVFHFVPIRYDLKQNNFLQENLQVRDDGIFEYTVEGQVVSHKGIDVSKFQGKIDWAKVAADGVEFAIIRMGYRGYGSEGKIVLDETYETNIKGAIAAGIKVGVYFFTQAITEEEALEEAQFVIEHLQGYDLSYPVVFDVEKTGASSGRMNQLTVEERTHVTRVFVDAIRDAGYTPMIYANLEMWGVLLDTAQFEDVEKWFAYYNSNLYLPYDYAIWQYSDTGHVNGISEEVDLNISFREW